MSTPRPREHAMRTSPDEPGSAPEPEEAIAPEERAEFEALAAALADRRSVVLIARGLGLVFASVLVGGVGLKVAVDLARHPEVGLVFGGAAALAALVAAHQLRAGALKLRRERAAVARYLELRARVLRDQTPRT